jgi:hypothetical protein
MIEDGFTAMRTDAGFGPGAMVRARVKADMLRHGSKRDGR